MIENYSEQIAKLISFGDKYYSLRIDSNYMSIPFSDLKVKYGTSITKNNRTKGKYIVYTSGGMDGTINKANLKAGVIFGCRGTLGVVQFSYCNCFVLNTAFAIETNEIGNLYFALRFHNGLSDYSSGAAQPQITFENIKSVVLRFPRDSTLEIIAKQIECLKNKRERLKEQKSLLLSKYF